MEIGWRGVYWYMFGLQMLLGALLVLFYFPPDFHRKHERDGKTKMQLLMELDYVGILLFAGASTLFLIGINFGGRNFPWRSAQVITCLVVSVVMAITLGLYECFADLKYPLFPPKLFKQIRG